MTKSLNSPMEAIEYIQEIKPRAKSGFAAVHLMIDGETIACTASKAINILQTVACRATFKAFKNAGQTLTIQAHN